jgi:exodeoxyribonuclease-5
MTCLTREQQHAVRSLLKNRDRDRVQKLAGFAGTGKSTVLSVLAASLPSWASCAFTGKAVNVLRRKGMDASTIHSLIYTPAKQPDGRVVFVLKTTPQIAYSGFLVDEASMVGRDLYRDLLSFGLPLIFVGDHGQLPPVGSDINLMEDPMYRLETIHRNAGPIAHFAQHLREGAPPWKFDGGDRVRVLDAADVDDDTLLSQDQVICGFNRTRVGVNARVRHLLGRKRLVQRGDRVMCLRNSRLAGLFNGQQGIVKAVDRKQCRMDFAADGILHEGVRYDPDVFGQDRPNIDRDPDAPHPFDYAYCVTCHKAQGDEWNRVLVLEQQCPYWEAHRWNYTAASRAKHRLFWVPATARRNMVRVNPS